MDRRRIEATFRGHVQGVGFRDAVRRLAVGRPLTGYVQNLADGRVRVVVEGSVGDVERFVADVQTRMAEYVADVEQQDAAATGEFSLFEIRR